jgi:hypothetical protein
MPIGFSIFSTRSQLMLTSGFTTFFLAIHVKGNIANNIKRTLFMLLLV